MNADSISRTHAWTDSIRTLLTWITISFAGVVFLVPSAQAVRQSTMRTQLQSEFIDAVTDALDVSGARVRVTEIKASSPKLLESRVRVERFELTRTRRPVGRVTARVTYRNGEQTSLAWVYANVQANIPIWVMSSTVERGAPIHRSAHVEMRDAARLPVDVLTGDASLLGRISARRLRNGAPLTASALTTPILVRRGDQVKVIVSVGSVQIAAAGTAMRDGRIGQSVPVRVRQGRIVQAAVAGPRRLEVQR